VLDATWSDALWAKAYALVEMNNFSEAKQVMEKALKLSPNNAKYLAEMGEILKREKKWVDALAIFKTTYDAAEFEDAGEKSVYQAVDKAIV
jgi:uncharacterized protein HemY